MDRGQSRREGREEPVEGLGDQWGWCLENERCLFPRTREGAAALGPLCTASFYLPQWWWRPQAALRAAAAVTADASCWLQEDGRAERRTELFSE